MLKHNLQFKLLYALGLIWASCESVGTCAEIQSHVRKKQINITPSDERFETGNITNEVIGFSQTASWFMPEFESHPQIDNDKWQLLKESGSSVERWANPDFVGWSNPIFSPATETTVTRVVFCISGAGRSQVQWASDIQAAVNTIRLKRPHVQEIYLEPVVGGPDHVLCQFDGQDVRASKNHPVIDLAIADVVAVNADTRPGLSPTVDDCAQYSDALGHLTASGQATVGAKMGDFYSTLPSFTAAETEWNLYD